MIPKLRARALLSVALLLLTGVQAFAQGASRRPKSAKSAASTQKTMSVVVLPVDSLGGDSLRVIVQRDLQNGDRVTLAFLDPALAAIAAPFGKDSVEYAMLAPTKAAVAVRIVRHPPDISVFVRELPSGTVKHSEDFHLPVVPDDRSQLIRDSVAKALEQRTADAISQLARDSVVRDSLLRANAAPPPKKRQNTKERAAARLLAAQRDTLVKEIEQRRIATFEQLHRDTVERDSIVPILLRTDSVTRHRANKNYRLALHSVSDAVEEWLTGVRGISATRIAYVEGRHMRVVDSDGANDEIVPTSGAAMSPAWHPTGKSIVYSDFTEVGTQIGEVNLGTGEWRMVVATPRGLNITPVYTPDGRSVVFGTGGERPADLVMFDLGGAGPPKPLSNGKFENSSPTFSPDGSRIAFMSPRPALTPQIFVMNADGTKVKLLTPFVKGRRSYRTGPDWSPTGDAVAYEQQNGDFQVWMISLKTGAMKRLTNYRENEDPSWAPDGRHMSITSTRGGTREIWVLDTKTGRFRQLTKTDGGRLSAWSPPLHPAP